MVYRHQRCAKHHSFRLHAVCYVLTKGALRFDYRNLFELFRKFANGESRLLHFFQTFCGSLGIAMERLVSSGAIA